MTGSAAAASMRARSAGSNPRSTTDAPERSGNRSAPSLAPAPISGSGEIVSGDLPPSLGDPPGLVEDAALGAGEREGLVSLDLAALQLVAGGGALHDVVAAVLVDTHTPLWPAI